MNERYRIRALLFQEYTARRPYWQARTNICHELGSNAISMKDACKWYTNFKRRNVNLRDADDPDYDKPLAIDSSVYLKLNKAVLFKTDDDRLDGSFVTVDGRFGLTYCNQSLKAVDFFHGRIADFSTDYGLQLPDRASIQIISDSRIFLLETSEVVNESYSIRVFAIDFDFNALKFDVVAQIERTLEPASYQFPMVNANMNAFGIFANHGYIIELQDDRIAISDYNLDGIAPELLCTKIEGKKLCGLRRSNAQGNVQYCQYDLQSMTAKTTMTSSVPEKLKSFAHIQPRNMKYGWSGDFLYLRCDHQEEVSIYRLDASSGIWTSFECVLADEIIQLDVSGDFMTVQVDEMNIGGSYELTTYRFPLRRPDTLANLAWFTILYHRNFRGSKIYDHVVNRLPYNSYLRCPFPDA